MGCGRVTRSTESAGWKIMRGVLRRAFVGTSALRGESAVLWHAPVHGEHLRGEQPVGAVATNMARIDLIQFCEPVAERLHSRLLLSCDSGDTAMTGPRLRLVVQAPACPVVFYSPYSRPAVLPSPGPSSQFFGCLFASETPAVMLGLIFFEEQACPKLAARGNRVSCPQCVQYYAKPLPATPMALEKS